MNIETIQHKIDRLVLARQTIKQQYRQEKNCLEKAKAYLQACQEAQQIGQTLAAEIQRRAHSNIANVVSLCLSNVYGGDYSYRIDFVKKRGKTEAKLVLLKNGHEIGNPLEEDSGGVLDVAALPQRLSCLSLTKPKLRPLLLLDEPFKNVHGKTYRKRVRAMLEELSEKFGMQIVLVTGSKSFYIGKVVRL